MKTLGAHLTNSAAAIATAVFSLTLGWAGDVSCPADTPMVKNLRAYSSHCSDEPAAEPHQLTKREVKRLSVTAKSAEDHLTIARYYEAEADRLETQAESYEDAAANYRQSPMAKNLTAPGTASHYEYLAQGFRKEAKSDRALAASQQEMAKPQAVAPNH